VIAWLVFVACGPPPAAVIDGDSPVEVRLTLDGAPHNGRGAVVVQAWYDADGDLNLDAPAADGLVFAPDGAARTEHIGDREVVTQRYVFRGEAGSYEIPPLVAAWTGPAGNHDARTDTLFVDIDAEPPKVGELADIVEPERVRRIPWLPILGVAGVVGAGLVIAFLPRRGRAPEPERPVPPDVACLRAWDEVRRDPDRDLAEKARELSVLFRIYVEAVFGFEATARTTSEILEHLRQLRHLPDGNVTRAQRVLRATDRVKFAEERPADHDWLAELDADLRAFVASTRPRVWAESQAAL
jgi:hypothetical protein